jgi:hypothetical protein
MKLRKNGEKQKSMGNRAAKRCLRSTFRIDMDVLVIARNARERINHALVNQEPGRAIGQPAEALDLAHRFWFGCGHDPLLCVGIEESERRIQPKI